MSRHQRNPGPHIAIKSLPGICGILVVGFLLVFSGLVPELLPSLEIPFRILVGWAFHAAHLFPRIRPGWSLIALSAACLLISATLGHRLIAWLRSNGKTAGPWRPVHTLISLLLLLMGAAAAISLSGVAHQLAWLRSEPVLVNRDLTNHNVVSASGEEVRCALADYAARHQRYPEDLRALVNENHLDASSMDGWALTPEAPFILLLPGQSPMKNGTRPLLMHITEQKQNKVLLVIEERGDTRIVPFSQLDAILQEARSHP